MKPSLGPLNLHPGRKVGKRYVVESLIGAGTEGEVYRVRERETGILRAAKCYTARDAQTRRRAMGHVRKLHDLRHCEIVMQYHHTEAITVRGQEVSVLISEFCEGRPLASWVADQPGGRLSPYMAAHLFHALMVGLESIHLCGEYHGDVHSENILVQPRGVSFDLKLIDFYEWGRPSLPKRQQDLRDAVAVFHEILGGEPRYARQPAPLKHVLCGMRRAKIIERFPNATALRVYLETFEWDRLG